MENRSASGVPKEINLEAGDRTKIVNESRPE